MFAGLGTFECAHEIASQHQAGFSEHGQRLCSANQVVDAIISVDAHDVHISDAVITDRFFKVADNFCEQFIAFERVGTMKELPHVFLYSYLFATNQMNPLALYQS